MKAILTITGSDPTGGSGLQADVLTIAELGGQAASVVTSITVQTTLGIQQFYDVPATIVQRQIDAVMNDLQPEVVKIGLVRRIDTLQVVVGAIRRYRPRHVVLDAVLFSSRGDTLVSSETLEAIRDQLLPLTTLVIRKEEGMMHGLSSRYASAVAVFLSQGAAIEEALTKARAYIGTQVAKATELKGRSSELYNEFLDAVAEHHREANNVSYYADLLNVSSRYLAQVTRRISGKSPKAIIDDCLAHEAGQLLKSTAQTVQEIAFQFGFSSQAHFAKFFKKLKGINPTQYRKQ